MHFRMLRTQNHLLKTPLPPLNAMNEIQQNKARPTPTAYPMQATYRT